MKYIITMETANGTQYLGSDGWEQDKANAVEFEHEQAIAIYSTLKDIRTGESLDYEEA